LQKLIIAVIAALPMLLAALEQRAEILLLGTGKQKTVVWIQKCDADTRQL
jgi:hypothetical protein